MPVTVTLPDGASLELQNGATGADAAAAIGPGLARAALAVEVRVPGDGVGEVRDLARPLPDGARISIITAKSGEPALELIRHDAAHVLTTADPEHPLRAVSLYTNGPFTDLCRGPHAPRTDSVGAFKLQSVAGAYWRGDSSRKMLTRIYGTAFFSKAELAAYLERLEQARARDHRRLGRELDLFMFSELSPGSPIFKPAGMAVWNALTELWRDENRKRGYQEVRTPVLYDVELFRQSGHWEKYRDNMYFTEVEKRPMGLKPMNCPAHIQIFNATRRSYRDLPVRLSEAGLVHRHEPSGVLHGLLR